MALNNGHEEVATAMPEPHTMNDRTPQILAPAGDAESFLAAVAAGADAVYAGLKHFSARMQAENFATAELARLAALGRDKGVRTYVPLNVLLKPGEEAQAGRLIQRLARQVKPDALIVQDLGILDLARQAGFTGELHLSTLAAVSHPAGLRTAEKLGASRVILPREFSIDEIKGMAEACPEGLDLEVFVHGALCYAVSGRCWWSSFLGGKSGLRGRCVQPCRRRYAKGAPPRAKPGRPGFSGRAGAEPSGERLFSCRDLSLDVLTRLLLDVPKVRCWKIEGRKKGPHYVFHTVAAYKALRDGQGSPESKKAAEDYLGLALGRPRTHYAFLPQKPHPAVTPAEGTTSGRFVGKLLGEPGGGVVLSPREPLLRGDRIRVGAEDEPGHAVLTVGANVPKKGRYHLKPPLPKKGRPPFGPKGKGARKPEIVTFTPGMPVHLIDRREQGLIALLAPLRAALERTGAPKPGPADFMPRMPRTFTPKPSARGGEDLAAQRGRRLDVHRKAPSGRQPGDIGLWLKPSSLDDTPRAMQARVWWWLPPVLWPEEEAWALRVLRALRNGGARRFVCNAPWQAELFANLDGPGKLQLWAGPFCNTSNALAVESLARLGFSGAIVSPELPREDLLALPRQSPLPLGVVAGGMWPLCVSRTKAVEVKTEEALRSPMGETLWVRGYGPLWWVFPGWPLDLTVALDELRGAGYGLFVHLHEQKPRAVPTASRTSTFNLDLQLL